MKTLPTLYLFQFIILMLTTLVYAKYRKPQLKYPKETVFWATDFFVRGCKNFLENCPAAYKAQSICGRSYGGEYRNFANYCVMQYENCNTWRKWRVFKREKC